MSPLPGIYASQISGHLFAPSGAYDSLASVTLSSATNAINFTSIPSGYKHLQIRVSARTAYAGAADNLAFQFNNTNTTGGAIHYLYGTGTGSAAGSASVPYNFMNGGIMPSATSTANVFNCSVIDILDYGSSNKNKTVRTLTGFDANGSGQVRFVSSFVPSTSPVTSIQFSTDSGNNFVVYTSFALYGVK